MPLRALETKDYTLGWIAASPVELAAALLVFEEIHAEPVDYEQCNKDLNTYTWGRIGKHNIVLTNLSIGVFGTNPSATTAWSLVNTFPYIEAGLVVGVGSGVPDLQEDYDIRLGDVVVSQPNGRTSGVVQYDLGKAKSGKWERRGFLNSPPENLLKTAALVKAQEIAFGSNIPEILDDLYGKRPYIEDEFGHPGSWKDRNFKASYSHISNTGCEDCDSEQQISRQPRASDGPETHYGVIASGNTIVEDAETRDLLISQSGESCIAFETGAAGIMNVFPCLVILGISSK
jgi:nucleoside phosphorylase